MTPTTAVLDEPATPAAHREPPPPPTRVELRAAALRQATADVMLNGAVPTTDDDDVFMHVLRPIFARCREVDPREFTPDDAWSDEPPAPYPSPAAKAACGSCPIRTSCLGYALRHNEVGVWGGTTEYQRAQLSRPRARASCPYCTSDMLVYNQRSEICLTCGTSWPLPSSALNAEEVTS